jgi:hypothetical protein
LNGFGLITRGFEGRGELKHKQIYNFWTCLIANYSFSLCHCNKILYDLE